MQKILHDARRSAIGAIYRLKAQKLMQMPTEDGLATVVPTFEYVVPTNGQ
jgi:hypothetical protein